jgi:hypothetical protein
MVSSPLETCTRSANGGTAGHMIVPMVGGRMKKRQYRATACWGPRRRANCSPARYGAGDPRRHSGSWQPAPHEALRRGADLDELSASRRKTSRRPEPGEGRPFPRPTTAGFTSPGTAPTAGPGDLYSRNRTSGTPGRRYGGGAAGLHHFVGAARRRSRRVARASACAGYARHPSAATARQALAGLLGARHGKAWAWPLPGCAW